MKNSVLCFLHTNTTYACGDLKENKGKKYIFLKTTTNKLFKANSTF